MTFETCKIQYNLAKERGDKEGMKSWAARAKLHGKSIEEETKSKEKK